MEERERKEESEERSGKKRSRELHAPVKGMPAEERFQQTKHCFSDSFSFQSLISIYVQVWGKSYSLQRIISFFGLGSGFDGNP